MRPWAQAASFTGSLCLLATACGQEGIHAVWPPGLAQVYLVLVPEDWRGLGAELEILGPFSPGSDPANVFEARPGTTVFSIGLDATRLSQVHPRLTSAAAWTIGPISSELAADRSCTTGGWMHRDLELELSFHAPRPGLETHRLDEETRSFVPTPVPELAGALSVRAPLEACFGGRRLRLEPFAETPDDGVEDLSSYGQVQYLDDDHAFVVGNQILRIVRRGERDPQERQLSVASVGLESPPPGTEWLFTAAALEGDSQSGRGVAALSLMSTLGTPTGAGVLFELTLTPTELVVGAQLFRTDTPARQAVARFVTVAFDQRGRWTSVGEGLVVSATTTRGRPSVIVENPNFSPTDVRATGLESHPFILVGKNLLLWGSPQSGANGLSPFPIADVIIGSRRTNAFDVQLDGDELIVHLLRSTVEISRGRVGGSGWVDQRIRVSEDNSVCAPISECGRAFASNSGDLLVAAERSLGEAYYVAPEGCAAAYLIDAQRDCAVSAPIELFDTVVAGDRDGGDLYRGVRRGERALFTGQRGRILEARLEP